MYSRIYTYKHTYIHTYKDIVSICIIFCRRLLFPKIAKEYWWYERVSRWLSYLYKYVCLYVCGYLYSNADLPHALTYSCLLLFCCVVSQHIPPPPPTQEHNNRSLLLWGISRPIQVVFQISLCCHCTMCVLIYMCVCVCVFFG